jgi:hypothetical protein
MFEDTLPAHKNSFHWPEKPLETPLTRGRAQGNGRENASDNDEDSASVCFAFYT